MRILFVASECAPFVKTGGLADVISALPKALTAMGVDVRILLPAYPPLFDAASNITELCRCSLPFGGGARVLRGEADGQQLMLLDAPEFFARAGNPYISSDGSDWPDNSARFAALAWTAAQIGRGDMPGWTPDIVHVHDWQAGLTPLYMRAMREPTPPCVMTIHNIAFQGLFPERILPQLSLPRERFQSEGYEYYGKVSYLKAGIVYADQVTTVSPTYAREILTPEYGMGMEGVLSNLSKPVAGILNGIDLEVWNPASDPLIAAPFDAQTLDGKARNKHSLEDRFGLGHEPESPLFCVISRLTSQKGLDLAIGAIPALLHRGARLVVLGTGDAALEQAFVHAAAQNPGRIGAMIDYDEALAHLMQAGSDAILAPSRFEPCGLTQLCGLRYGALPVVCRTGGLADTIIDANAASLKVGCATGFQFPSPTISDLTAAIERVCACFSNKEHWRTMQRQAMTHPSGWDQAASAYASLYQAQRQAHA
jgi:starch synthase